MFSKNNTVNDTDTNVECRKLQKDIHNDTYLFQGLSVCPFVCLLAGICKYCWLELHEEKSEDGSWTNLNPTKA